jgi:hypothetical protein
VQRTASTWSSSRSGPELFDRVQEVRTWRARIVKPGPPSDDYLLRKLLYCDRRGSRMHGTRGSRRGIRRYHCSSRRYGHGCDQPMTQAEPLEEKLVRWLSDFQPDEELRRHALAHVRQEARRRGGGELRRRELMGQLERLRDLYVMNDLSKNEYVLRRQATEEELERIGPPFDPEFDEADELLAKFADFWATEPSPAERRRVLATLLDRVWQDGGAITAVKPRTPFLRYFQMADELAQRRARRRGDKHGSDGRPPMTPRGAERRGGVTKAGAMGVDPWIYTPRHRDPALTRVNNLSDAFGRAPRALRLDFRRACDAGGKPRAA